MSALERAERNPVTTILVVGAIAATLAKESGRSVEHLILTPYTAMAEPWRFFTTIFPHGGALHLLFNVFWTIRLGVALEERMGSLRMLGLALVTSVVAAACEVSLFNSGIGLSGAVYGIALYAWSRGRHDPRYSGIVTQQDLTLFIAWFFLCIIATYTGVMAIANAAHGGGAVIGFLLGSRKTWLAPVFVVIVGAFTFNELRTQPYLTRELVGLIKKADDALKDEDYEYAVQIFERIFDEGGTRPADRYNYGVALYKSGRMREGLDAMVEAAEKDLTVVPVQSRPLVLREMQIRQRAEGDD